MLGSYPTVSYPICRHWDKIPQLKTKPSKKPRKSGENVMSLTPEENDAIKHEIQPVIDELKNKGINFNSSNEGEITGLGDIVESTLNTFGVTQEKFKKWFNLRECNCNERKKWLNNLFSWKKNKDENN
jgi:hypothetical protein